METIGTAEWIRRAEQLKSEGKTRDEIMKVMLVEFPECKTTLGLILWKIFRRQELEGKEMTKDELEAFDHYFPSSKE